MESLLRLEIAEHEKTEKKLGESEERYRSLVAATTDVVWSTNATGEVGTGENRVAALTPREQEVARQLAEGGSNKEIEATLKISVRTVETHRAALLRKLGLRSVADLVRYAIRNSIIEP
ncbi:MAG: LuxR C-terminal-related transcriptional regulator [Chthoniobacterales bacterium]